MPSHHVDALSNLLEEGMKAVGFHARPIKDDGFITIHDLFVDVSSEIMIYRASDPEHPVMTFPLDATEGAASAICARILAEVAARAIEESVNA